MRKPTIADELNGKPITESMGPVIYDASSGIYTFADGSTAILITHYKECDPYQAKSTSTMSKTPYRVWMKK